MVPGSIEKFYSQGLVGKFRWCYEGWCNKTDVLPISPIDEIYHMRFSFEQLLQENNTMHHCGIEVL